MTQTMIEDGYGTTAEVSECGKSIELSATAANGDCVSLVLTPRQARFLARQLLAQADDADES